MRAIRAAGIVGLSVVLAACEPVEQDRQSIAGDSTEAVEREQGATPSEATLELAAEVLDQHRVEFTIDTTLPLPVTVTTSVDLKGQEPEDTYIGYSGGRVDLQEPTTVVVLDTSQARMPLPAGDYIAEVSFYATWGAEGNAEAARASELHDTVDISLTGSGGTVESAVRRDELRGWIMEEVVSNSLWDRQRMERRLGPSEKLVADRPAALDAYYFPEADATMIVNRARNVVLIWRFGRATS